MVKNHTIRIKKETMDLISEIADKLGFNKVDLATHLLNRSLVQLKADSQKAGGFEKLEFTLRNN